MIQPNNFTIFIAKNVSEEANIEGVQKKFSGCHACWGFFGVNHAFFNFRKIEVFFVSL